MLENQDRRFRFGWTERIVLLAAFLLLAGFLIWDSRAAPSGTAYITLDGAQIMTVELNSAQDRIISLREEYGVPAELEVSGGRIRFVNVTCPDHLCERTGFIHKDGQAAVCMPNRVAVVVALF